MGVIADADADVEVDVDVDVDADVEVDVDVDVEVDADVDVGFDVGFDVGAGEEEQKEGPDPHQPKIEQHSPTAHPTCPLVNPHLRSVLTPTSAGIFIVEIGLQCPEPEKLV